MKIEEKEHKGQIDKETDMIHINYDHDLQIIRRTLWNQMHCTQNSLTVSNNVLTRDIEIMKEKSQVSSKKRFESCDMNSRI